MTRTTQQMEACYKVVLAMVDAEQHICEWHRVQHPGFDLIMPFRQTGIGDTIPEIIDMGIWCRLEIGRMTRMM